MPTLSLSPERGEHNEALTGTFSGFTPGASIILQAYASIADWQARNPLQFVGPTVAADAMGDGVISTAIPFLGIESGDFFFDASQLLDGGDPLVTTRSPPQKLRYEGAISELKPREFGGFVQIPVASFRRGMLETQGLAIDEEGFEEDVRQAIDIVQLIFDNLPSIAAAAGLIGTSIIAFEFLRRQGIVT